MPRTRTILAVALAALMLAGCSAPAPAPQPATTPGEAPTPTPSLHGELRIFAAASLTDAFTELAEQFHTANPGVTVAPITFDGSATLATQILEGAPADIFAAADEKSMAQLTEMLDGEPTVFASNTLQIAVAPGNPLGIRSLADVADGAAAGAQLVLCAPEVPCGRAARTLLDGAGVSATPVSEEQNVKAVLSKVQLGEADAGLVYVTDVAAAAGSVDGVPIDGAEQAANSYPIAALAESGNVAAARAFLAYVLSPVGQETLAGYGFGAP